MTDGVDALTARLPDLPRVVPASFPSPRSCASLRWPASLPSWPAGPEARAACSGARRMPRTTAKRWKAARQHLDQSVHARERAESALAALDARDAELSEQNRLFNAALAKMSQGLCMFDQDQKLLVCNDRYIEMYGLSKELAKRGTPFRKIIESRIAKGLYVGDNAEAYLDERLASAREAVRNTQAARAERRARHRHHARAPGGRRMGGDARRRHAPAAHRGEAVAHVAPRRAHRPAEPRAAARAHAAGAVRRCAWRGASSSCCCSRSTGSRRSTTTLGPSIGDALLQSIAQRLRRRLDGADMVARIGGDEFVVLQVGRRAGRRGRRSRQARAQRARHLIRHRRSFGLDHRQRRRRHRSGRTATSPTSC